MDCTLIKYAIWNTEQQYNEVEEIIETILKENGLLVTETDVEDFNTEIENFEKEVQNSWKKNKGSFSDATQEQWVAAFDSAHYFLLIKKIKNSIEEVEVFKTQCEEPFKKNIFADKKFSSIIVEKITETIKKLQDMKLKLEEHRSNYSKGEQIKPSSSTKNLKKDAHSVSSLVELVQVDGGTFHREGDKITVSDFLISKYQVTQELYQKIMGENPSYNSKGGKYPVESVSWHDAVNFCNKLSKNEGLTPCYDDSGDCDFSANGYRLPTEAEWEFAARGGNNSKGYKYSGSDNIDAVAWYTSNYSYINYSDQTSEVGKKKANELGIFDMSGNVWEWCNDWYGRIDPRGDLLGTSRVIRGGSCSSDADKCTVSYRSNSDPDDRDSDLGFRLVRSF